MQLTYEIPDNKVAEYVADYCYIFKNTETIPDPENEGQTLPKYTDAQWVREHIMRWVRSQIVRGKNAQYRDDVESFDVSDVT